MSESEGVYEEKSWNYERVIMNLSKSDKQTVSEYVKRERVQERIAKSD